MVVDLAVNVLIFIVSLLLRAHRPISIAYKKRQAKKQMEKMKTQKAQKALKALRDIQAIEEAAISD